MPLGIFTIALAGTVAGLGVKEDISESQETGDRNYLPPRSGSILQPLTLEETYCSLVTPYQNGQNENESPINWLRFQSINYPYEIKYPQEWTARSTTVEGKRLDIFRKYNNNALAARISCEEVGDSVTPEAYVQNVGEQLKSRGVREVSTDFEHMSNIEILGKKVYMVSSRYDGFTQDVRAIFLEQGHAWTLEFFINPGYTKPDYSGQVEQFSGILSSFKILK